jgi:hypothetical protein
LAGLAVFSRLLKDGKGILLKSETDYIKKAKGMAEARQTQTDLKVRLRGLRHSIQMRRNLM